MTMKEMLNQFVSVFKDFPGLHFLLHISVKDGVIALAILVLGYFVSRRTRSAISKLSGLEPGQSKLAQKLAYGTILTLTLALALDQLGFNLKVLLGAAGVLTVAVGFAAQTSASNLISGLFLMFERPFVVGQVIAVGDLRGEVIEVGLLSTQIRAQNNVIIRIPNETLVKSNITNLSHFPMRRIELAVGVTYDCRLDEVETLLREIVVGHPRVLSFPEPLVLVDGFGDSAVNFKLLVWVPNDLVLTVPHELYKTIHEAFELRGVSIPYPTRTVFTHSSTASL